MAYRVTKTYPHELGLSACFRQWRASSHCRFLHGYPLSFELIFESDKLNHNNWVIDFGSLKPVKQFLIDTFDHKTVVAADDPVLFQLQTLSKYDCADVVVLPAVGCEAFAEYVFGYVEGWLTHHPGSEHVKLVSVECREHGGNSATYIGD